jgi:tetratricopeptide (TPR) repeat protein
MRTAAALLVLALSAAAGPKSKDLPFVKDPQTAVEIARTRGKLILLTVIVDTDDQNRAVIDTIFRDREFRKISKEFVLLYANVDFKHGSVKRKTPAGKSERRCADCPAIKCEDHILVAQQYARGFYPSTDCKTPAHFVIDKNEDLVEMIYEGDLESGLHCMPVKRLIGQLKRLLDKHGRGLSEAEYKRMVDDLAEARAARARDKTTFELKKLLEVVKLDRDVEGVNQARKRVAEIDKLAAAQLAKAEEHVEAEEWEPALDTLESIAKTYPGAPTALVAEKRRKDLLKQSDVKKLLKARDLFNKAMAYKEKGKIDLARKKLEQCVRQYKQTPYAAKAQAELEKL